MSTLGMVHLAFALTALSAGTIVIATRKGTRYHRTFGHVYFTSNLAVNATALLIYNLTGRFNFFHVSALFSLAFTLLGMVPVITRRPRLHWLELHARFVTGSYVGIVAAAAAEVATRVPGWNFGAAAGITSLVVLLAGMYLIATRTPATIDRLHHGRRVIDPKTGRATG
ncbi:MAG TPA: DUF2306 domain-containing protein [Anaerolineae bacterium]|nr:DUF2306 domain-containing protein [Anaerolineae bacterium]